MQLYYFLQANAFANGYRFHPWPQRHLFERGAVVRDLIVMEGRIVKEGSVVEHAIVDRSNVILRVLSFVVPAKKFLFSVK